MDLFSEHFARSERSAVEHDLARGEALGRHLAGSRPIRRRRRLLTGWQFLGVRRRRNRGTSATTPATTLPVPHPRPVPR
jgi:hypothetical protein